MGTKMMCEKGGNLEKTQVICVIVAIVVILDVANISIIIAIIEISATPLHVLPWACNCSLYTPEHQPQQ